MVARHTGLLAVALLWFGCEACQGAGAPPSPRVGGRAHAQAPAPEEAEVEGPETSDTPSSNEGRGPPAGEEGRNVLSDPIMTRTELADLDARGCRAALAEHGVRVEAVPARRADGVSIPVRLDGPVGGVEVHHVGRSARHEILDCRLAVTLLGWAPALRAAGVERIEHMSIYRPGARVRGTGEPSGHAAGTAIDAARFALEDGTTLDVERDWSDKTPGAAPCGEHEDEPDSQRILRDLVCHAVEAGLFQVVVTPHGNRRHHDHVHLEIRPEVDWTHLR